MNFKLNLKAHRHRYRSTECEADILERMDAYKREYKFYKDRPVNEIQNQDTETEDSLLEADTEVPEESDDNIETVAEPGYNFIELEVV